MKAPSEQDLDFHLSLYPYSLTEGLVDIQYLFVDKIYHY